MERFILEGQSRRLLETAPDIPEAARGVVLEDQQVHQPVSAPGGFGSGGTKRRWRDADDARLKELWHSSIDLEGIAKELDRTIPSLYSRARALGMPKRFHDPQDKDSDLRHTPGAGQKNGARGKGSATSFKGHICANTDEAQTHNGNGGRADVRVERYRPKGRRTGQSKRTRNGNAGSAHNGLTTAKSQLMIDEDFGVETVIQFLRSRDYSVVRVGDGQFKLDGRRILTADELREKANQVRRTLGQPPFASLRVEPASF